MSAPCGNHVQTSAIPSLWVESDKNAIGERDGEAHPRSNT